MRANLVLHLVAGLDDVTEVAFAGGLATEHEQAVSDPVPLLTPPVPPAPEVAAH